MKPFKALHTNLNMSENRFKYPKGAKKGLDFLKKVGLNSNAFKELKMYLESGAGEKEVKALLAKFKLDADKINEFIELYNFG